MYMQDYGPMDYDNTSNAVWLNESSPIRAMAISDFCPLANTNNIPAAKFALARGGFRWNRVLRLVVWRRHQRLQLYAQRLALFE